MVRTGAKYFAGAAKSSAGGDDVGPSVRAAAKPPDALGAKKVIDLRVVERADHGNLHSFIDSLIAPAHRAFRTGGRRREGFASSAGSFSMRTAHFARWATW
jgi:hypothetical protein